jgi:hypothetical protein
MFSASSDIALRRRESVNSYRPIQALLLAVAAMGAGALLAAQSAGASSRTASQVVAASKAAASSEASLHYVSTTKTPTDSVTITGDVSKTEGKQTIVANVDGQIGHVTVELVGGTAYFEGDEPGLATFMGLSQSIAMKYENQWISLTASDTAFSSVAAGLTTSSALLEASIASPLALRGTSEKSGQRVLVLGGFDSGTPAGATKKVVIPVRLYVQAKGRSLPVLYTASDTVGKRKESTSVAFSNWGEPVGTTAPPGAVPIAILGSSPVEA